MAYAAVKFLQESLKTKFDLISSGAREELKLLESDISFLEAFINKDPVNTAEKVKRELERQIVDAVHGVEDAINTFLSLGKAKLGDRHVNQLAGVVRSFREEKLKQNLFLHINLFYSKYGEGSVQRQTKLKKVAYVAVKSLQETLSQLKKTKFGLFSGATEEMKLLETDVSFLEAFVNKDPVNTAEKVKKKLERQIVDVVHGVEDAIDTFLLLGKAKVCDRHVNQLAQVVRSFREEKLKQNLFVDIKLFYLKYGEGSCERQAKLGKVPCGITRSLWQDSNDVSQRDEEDILIGYLMEQRDKLDVITLSGADTTTLALAVYNSQKIQYEFPTRIWLDMSYCFSDDDKFLYILKQLSSDLSNSNLSYRRLLETIRAHLEECKFLLVINDVSLVKTWVAISKIFPHQNKMGKVLITTQSEEVSSHAYHMTKRDPIKMHKLSDFESWTLLQLKVYGKVHGCTTAIKNTGESIARRCHGVPLVIALIAGNLRAQLYAIKQNQVDAAYAEWVEMEKRISILRVGSFELSFSQYVKLVYHCLPLELRDCFLYLGVFPEEYEISKWTLTCLWIAEGFILPKDGQSLEEAAEENLKELIIRNLLMVDKMSGNGQVRTTRVLKRVSRFCCSEALKQDLFSVIMLR